MNSTHEQISALMDEQPVSSSALDEVLDNEDSVRAWSRYHLIRDALQNELQQESITDISQRVSLALADEPAILAPANIKPRRINQSIVGFAMAASVFFVALLGWQQLQAPVVAPEQAAPAIDVVANETRIAPVAKITAQPAIDEERARLEDMLITHTEAVSANGINLMMPYTRVVSARLELPAEMDKSESVDSDNAKQQAKDDEAKAKASSVEQDKSEASQTPQTGDKE